MSEPTRMDSVLEAFMRTLEARRDADPIPCARCGADLWAHGDPIPADPDLCQRCGRERGRAREVRRLMEAMLPPRFRGESLDTYRCPPGDPRALDVARAYRWEEGRGLYLWSREPGRGKSHLAYGIARRAIESGVAVEAHAVPALLARIRATYRRSDDPRRETADDIAARLERAPLLILDDFGTEKVSEWVREILFLVADGRYGASRPTVITSNLPPGQLAARLGDIEGDRIVSRLVGGAQVVEVEGQMDYRMRRRA
jgi:DNA replication protein DnaC